MRRLNISTDINQANSCISNQIKRNMYLKNVEEDIAYVYLGLLLLVAYEYTHIKLHKKP